MCVKLFKEARGRLRLAVAPVVGAVLALAVVAAPADAKRKQRQDAPHQPRIQAHEVDCTPRNGWGGYYGNPWCRTGPSEAGNRRQHGYPAWVPKKYRDW